jgi:hypothetical protein
MISKSDLVERAHKSSVAPALIQNGSSSESYSERGVKLVERAVSSTVKPALIQNGSSSETYTKKGI